MINNVSMPAFSRVQHDADLLRNTMASALRSLSLVVMPMCALIMVLARPLVLTLYGAKWAASADVLSVLALYSAVSVICLLFANILAGLGRTTFLLVVQLVWLGALVPAMVLGVHQDGIVGAAYAHIAVIGPVVLPSYLLVLRRVTGVRFSALAKAVLPAFLAAAAAAAAAWAAASLLSLPLAQLVAGGAVGGLVYVLAAAPLLIALLGQTTNPHALRILGVYGAAARLVGLPGAAQPKHSAGSGRWRAPQEAGAAGEAPVPVYQLFTPAGRPVSHESVQSTAAALALLISLARPEPPAAPLARPGPRTVPLPRQRPMALAVPYERHNSQR